MKAEQDGGIECFSNCSPWQGYEFKNYLHTKKTPS